jgi:hypothetical protein
MLVSKQQPVHVAHYFEHASLPPRAFARTCPSFAPCFDMPYNL